MKPSYRVLRVSSRGFTMIELLVTLVVFGIMVGLAAPAMGGWINRSSLDGALGQFTGDVAYARMVAVRAAQPVEVVIESTSYTIRRVEASGQTTQVKRVNLAAEYPGMTVTSPAVTLRFNSRGVLDAAADQTVSVQRRSRSASVQVLPTGRVYREY